MGKKEVAVERPRCFFDVNVDGASIGRIVFELFADVCPITCDNFRALCTGEKGRGQLTGKPLHYKGCAFHRVVKNFMVQGGDFTAGNGTGGESVYGGTFADENFLLKHDDCFILSMANRGKDTNGSQFFITTRPTPHLDGVHVVFGKVISGQQVVTEIENQKTDPKSNRPISDVVVSNCGELVKKKKRQRSSSSTKSQTTSRRRRSRSKSGGEHRDRSRRRSKEKRKKDHRERRKDEKDKDKPSKITREDSPPAEPVAEIEVSTVKAEEVPDVPANKFLFRYSKSPPPKTEPTTTTSKDNIDDQFRNNRGGDRGRPRNFGRRIKYSRSGHRIRGRGALRYQTPSPDGRGSRGRSETPPHWRREQAKLKSLNDVAKANANEEIENEDEQEQVSTTNREESDRPYRNSNDKYKNDRDSEKKRNDASRNEERLDRGADRRRSRSPRRRDRRNDNSDSRRVVTDENRRRSEHRKNSDRHSTSSINQTVDVA